VQQFRVCLTAQAVVDKRVNFYDNLMVIMNNVFCLATVNKKQKTVQRGVLVA